MCGAYVVVVCLEKEEGFVVVVVLFQEYDCDLLKFSSGGCCGMLRRAISVPEGFRAIIPVLPSTIAWKIIVHFITLLQSTEELTLVYNVLTDSIRDLIGPRV